MSQFELIEDYLTHRLDDGARSAFEEQMNANPQLKAEVNLQKGIIEGVKSARAAELKAMLNNVPVGGTASTVIGKIAIATISAGILGTALYFGLRSTPTQEQQVKTEETNITQPLTPIEEPQEKLETIIESNEGSKADLRQKPNETTPKVKQPKEEKVSSPRIDVLDLTEEMKENREDVIAPKSDNKPTISPSAIEVDLNTNDKDYSFHYQFKDSKLVLYGPFDSSLYEIIELNGDIRSIFLYYNNSYYKLDENEHDIVPLIMIRDQALLIKLEKYRKKN
ncbi:MAG: hypothetical protein KF860_02610 [Cyclobacteriaceae bacterium]|nr:hypothetical protein [Cyclobacteriaceae bacterium]